MDNGRRMFYFAIDSNHCSLVHGGFLFISGQLPLDPVTGAMAGEDAAQQIHQCLTNLRAIAEAAGTSVTRTVKTTVQLTDLSEFAAVNEVYSGFFADPYPARACYQVAALPKGARVEVEAVVALD